MADSAIDPALTGTTLRFDVVDVFADRPFAGNPLAVVHGASGLETSQLQALAREFNLSETVFPLPVSSTGADYRARIFTPASELPFAGHPSVGVAWVLGRDGVIGYGDAVQECGAGLLPVTVSSTGARVYGGAPTLGPSLDAAALAAAVGLEAGDVERAEGTGGLAGPGGAAGAGGPGGAVGGAGGPGDAAGGPGDAAGGPGGAAGGAGGPGGAVGGPGDAAGGPGDAAGGHVAGAVAQAAGAGLEWSFLGVRADAVARAVLPTEADLAGLVRGTGLVVVAFDPEARRAHVRAFAPGQGVPEDPATGSAAVALGVWLVARGLLPADGSSEVTIAQGAETGRPSRLELTVVAEAGRAVRTSVGGNVAPVSSGTIAIPPLP